MNTGTCFVGTDRLFVAHCCHGVGGLGTVMILVGLLWKSWTCLVNVVGYHEDRWVLMRARYTGNVGPRIRYRACTKGT